MTKYIEPHLRLPRAMPRVIRVLAGRGVLRDGFEISLNDICNQHVLLKEALPGIGDGDIRMLIAELQGNPVLLGHGLQIDFDYERRVFVFSRRQEILRKVAGDDYL